MEFTKHPTSDCTFRVRQSIYTVLHATFWVLLTVGVSFEIEPVMVLVVFVATAIVSTFLIPILISALVAIALLVFLIVKRRRIHQHFEVLQFLIFFLGATMFQLQVTWVFLAGVAAR